MRMCASRMPSPQSRRRCIATPSATSACISRTARRRWRRCSARYLSGVATTSSCRAATTHRWLPTGDEPLRTYVIEANSHITPPLRYLSKFGQLLEHSPYCERDLRGPSEPLLADGRRGGLHQASRVGARRFERHDLRADEHPFDVVGWDGCLYPYVFNVADFEPITGRVHQPPPVHQVFQGNNFVVCNFVPRKARLPPARGADPVLPRQRRLR